MKSAIVLCIGLILSEYAAEALQPARTLRRSGTVRLLDRALADAQGPFNALGATLFWGTWAMKFDRPRLRRNFAALQGAGIDYVRVLGSVGGASWADRLADPRWQDYDAIIAGLTDLAYDEYGIRIQWTLFGGAPFTPAGPPRVALVDRFAKMARGREHKILAFEIANEAWHNGFENAEGLTELRRLGQRLAEQTTVLVALSAPAPGALCETYAGSGVDIMTMHYPRGFGREGPLRPLRRLWNESADKPRCAGPLPPGVLNNEPIGPESSVEQDADAARIAAAYVMTFLAGNAAYVLHSGPGIRGGGAADLAVGRHEDFDQIPAYQSITRALAAARQFLPHGVANWTRHGPNAAEAPVRGHPQVYTASSGGNFVAVVLRDDRHGTLTVNMRSHVEVRNPATGELVASRAVKPGDTVSVAGYEVLVLIGRA